MSEPSAPLPPPSTKMLAQADMFRNRLINRARHLRRWPKRGITCYRLYERDIPDVPLVIDRYEDFLHVAEFYRPHDRTPQEHAAWLELMLRTAAEALETPLENIFFKRRERQSGKAQYDRVAQQEKIIIVQEAGLRFRVNLSDYLDTGLFLDHRLTRGMVRAAAAGKRFLNLFCYTGSFTVYAAAGQAASTVSVDTSRTYLTWAEENLRLNNLLGAQHQFIREDAVEFVRQHPPGEHFDLAIVDPPTFSNSKRSDMIWDVTRDHAALLSEVLHRMPPGGTVFFSTNSRRFQLDEDLLAPLAAIRDITRQTLPEDFRNEKIHYCWRLVRRDGT